MALPPKRRGESGPLDAEGVPDPTPGQAGNLIEVNEEGDGYEFLAPATVGQVPIWTEVAAGVFKYAPGSIVDTDPLLSKPLTDDFTAGGGTISAPGAGTQIRTGLGETGWTGVFVNATAGDVWAPPASAPSSGAIGVARLSANANGTVGAICRGLSATDVSLCRMRDIQRLTYLFASPTQDSTTSGLLLEVGAQANWASLSTVMLVERQPAVDTDFVLRRSGQPNLSTGVSAIGDDPHVIRFQQRIDGVTGIGSGTWDLFIDDLTTPVVEGYTNPAVGINTAINVGMQVQKLVAAGVASEVDIDYVQFVPFEQTLAQRIAA